MSGTQNKKNIHSLECHKVTSFCVILHVLFFLSKSAGPFIRQHDFQLQMKQYVVNLRAHFHNDPICM